MKHFLILLCMTWTILVGFTFSQATGTTLLTTTTLSPSILPTNLPVINHPIIKSTTLFQNTTSPWSICMATETSCALPGGGNTCCSEGLTCLQSGSFTGTCVLASPEVESCPPFSICVPKVEFGNEGEAFCCAQDEMCTEVGCWKETGSTGPNDPGEKCDVDSTFVTLPEPSCCGKENVCTFNKDGKDVMECCEVPDSCTWMGCENLQFAIPRRRLFRA